MKNWLAGATPACSSPAYVRDNIHVSLLAKVYAQFAADFPATGFTRINPSGYAESQGAFTLRLAQEMRPRLGLPCLVELKKQIDFPEPRVRINTDIPDTDCSRLGRVSRLGRDGSLLPIPPHSDLEFGRHSLEEARHHRESSDEGGDPGWGTRDTVNRGNRDSPQAHGRDRRKTDSLAHHEALRPLWIQGVCDRVRLQRRRDQAISSSTTPSSRAILP